MKRLIEGVDRGRRTLLPDRLEDRPRAPRGCLGRIMMRWIDAGTNDDPDAELPGIKSVGGRLVDFDPTTAVFEGETVTRHLEDGRRLDIIPHHSARC